MRAYGPPQTIRGLEQPRNHHRFPGSCNSAQPEDPDTVPSPARRRSKLLMFRRVHSEETESPLDYRNCRLETMPFRAIRGGYPDRSPPR